VGRFSQADKWGQSILFPTIYKKFTYVFNNPLIYIDPYGLYTHIIVKGDVTSSSDITTRYNSQLAGWKKAINDKDPNAKILVWDESNLTGLDFLQKINSFSKLAADKKIASLYTFGHGGTGHINLGTENDQDLNSSSFLKMKEYNKINSLASAFNGSADIIFKHCHSRNYNENTPQSIAEHFEKFINTEKTKNIVTGYNGEIKLVKIFRYQFQYWSDKTTIDKKNCD
jgi:hypothetical protein